MEKKFMSLNEIIANIAEGNSKALEILKMVAQQDAFDAAENDDFSFANLKTINNYEIYGNKFERFYEKCCSDDYMIFGETLTILAANILPVNLVHQAIEQGVSIVDMETLDKYLDPILNARGSEADLFKEITSEEFVKVVTGELKGKLQEKEAPIKNYVKPAKPQTINDVIKKLQNYLNSHGDNSELVDSKIDAIVNNYDLSSKQFVRLFEETCDGNCHKLNITLMHLLTGMFNQNQIDKNLNLTCPVPFVDKNVFANHNHYISLNDEHIVTYAELYNLLESEKYRKDLINAFELNYAKSLDAFGNGGKQPNDD